MRRRNRRDGCKMCDGSHHILFKGARCALPLKIPPAIGALQALSILAPFNRIAD